MDFGRPNAPRPANEPTLGYAPGSPERQRLQRALDAVRTAPAEVPV